MAFMRIIKYNWHTSAYLSWCAGKQSMSGWQVYILAVLNRVWLH